MPWSAVASAATSAVVGSILSPDKSGGQAAQQAADPFGPERSKYWAPMEDFMGANTGGFDAAKKLKEMINGNFTIQDPSYKFRFDQGMEALNRGVASKGLLKSGNRLLALADYGQQAGSTEYAAQFSRLQAEANNRFAQLASLGGVTNGQPGVAGQIAQQNYAADQKAAGAVASQVGEWVGKNSSSWGNTISGWFNGGGGGTSASIPDFW